MKAISLMYHDVCDEASSSGFAGADAGLYKISEAGFRSHLDAIGRSGVRPGIVTDWNPGSNGTFITFDDGGKSAMRAADMLDERGWKGHFMVTTSMIGTAGFVGEADIVELDRRGHAVCSHSDSHPLRMASLSRESILREWNVSLDTLADLLGKRPEAASVPGGMYSREVAESAEESGIRFLFNSEPTTAVAEVGSCRVFGRYTVRKNTSDAEVGEIVRGSVLPRLKQSIAWNAKKPFKRVGGKHFLSVRHFLLGKTLKP